MRIGLGIPRQQPFMEFVNGTHRIWIIYNKNASAGTYYELFPTGAVDRVTVDEFGNRTQTVRISS